MEKVIAELRTLPPHPLYASAQSHAYFALPRPTDLLIDEVEALWAPIADKDDWGSFEAHIAAIRLKGDAYAPLLPEPQTA